MLLVNVAQLPQKDRRPSPPERMPTSTFLSFNAKRINLPKVPMRAYENSLSVAHTQSPRSTDHFTMMDRFPDVHVSCAGGVHVKGRKRDVLRS